MEKKNQPDTRAQEMFSKIEAYLSGNLSQQQFCQGEGLAKSTFQYWLRKYRRVNNHQIVSSGDFLPVQMVALNGDARMPADFEIELPGKLVIRFHSVSLNSSLVNLIHSLVD